jgi:phage tail-like protein
VALFRTIEPLIRLDPPLANNFFVVMFETSGLWAGLKSAAFSIIGDVLIGGFSECDGLDMRLEEEKYHEGGRNDMEHRFPTRITWPNLTLKRGVSRISQSGWDWLYEYGDGKGKRQDGLVVLLDRAIPGSTIPTPHNVWYFKNAIPVKFEGPALRASVSEVAVETLEIAHEGLWQLSLLKVLGQAASAVFS